MLFEPEIGQGDAEDKAQHKGHEAGQGDIEKCGEVEGFGLFGEEVVVDVDGDQGMADPCYGEQEEGAENVGDDPAFLVKEGEEEADIAIDDQGIEEAADQAIDDGLQEAVFRHIGQHAEEADEAPDQELQLYRGGLAEENAHPQR